MIASEVASRYARALFKLGATPPELEKRHQDLDQVAGLLKQVPRLGLFLSAPQITRPEKENLLEKSLGERVDPRLLRFILFLLEKGRLKFLPEIAQSYHRLVKENLGILEARLITAVPADPGLKDRLRTKLEKSYRKRIEMQEKQDPKIIGGVVLIIANQVMDWSIRERLSSLKEDLLAASI